MEGQLIDVEYVEGFSEICKIKAVHHDVYDVYSLVFQEDEIAYKFDYDSPHSIPRDSVSGYYDSQRLEDTGNYVLRSDGIHYDCLDDSDFDLDYEQDSDETDESDNESDISLYDEQEYEFE